jgi:hypothetical protein
MKKRAKSKSKKARSKNAKSKAKVSAKAKSSAKAGKKKSASRRKSSTRRVRSENIVPQSSQSVETVPMKGRALRARAGAGGGDFGGTSVVENVDSESVDELLEEGQAFEAGVVSGVEDAPDADQGAVRTREVPEDDVPEEYDNQDRPR